MSTQFSKNIATHVISEIVFASEAKALGNTEAEFKHLENAHIIGQE